MPLRSFSASSKRDVQLLAHVLGEEIPAQGQVAEELGGALLDDDDVGDVGPHVDQGDRLAEEDLGVVDLEGVLEGEDVDLDGLEVLAGLVDDVAVVGDLVLLGGDEEDVQVPVLAARGAALRTA